MARLGEFEVHPFADAFPLIDGDEFDQLVMDIKKNGLREPIVLNHDRTVLVDGRNRYRACEAAGADPVFETLPERYTEPLILDLIVSKNMARRQLNAGQRALMALEYERYYAAAAKASQREAGRQTAEKVNAQVTSSTVRADLREPSSTPEKNVWVEPQTPRDRRADERAAKAVGASGRAVQQAKAVARDAPDLADKVRRGELALDRADRERKQRLAAMPKPEPAPKPSQVMLTLRTHTGDEVKYPQPAAKATFNESKGAGISWAAWSWNPVTGCLHGCGYCYARAIATDERYSSAYPAGFTPLFHHERLDAPANTVIPAARRDDPAYQRVFVCSMADLYGRWVPDEWIAQVHASMCANPRWQYITLTKFPARYVGLDMPPGAWIGTSVDEQKRVRIAEDAFRKIDGGAVKWLSLEPLKEPLEFTDLSVFDWVVIGAQTETRQPDGVVPAFAPPFEWVARIVVQALDAGCKVHLKPNLRSQPGMQWLDQYPTVSPLPAIAGQVAFDA
jgi:protein gp37/ParB-like chromosome segregation protein Spo0J